MHTKRTVKRAAIIVLVLAVFFIGAHLFITWRAKQILNYIVQEASSGAYLVSTKKVRFNYYPLRISASGISLLPVDSSSSNYYTSVADSFYIEVAGIWSLISRKNFTIKKVHIVHPQINVINRASDEPPRPFNLALSDIQFALVQSLSEFKVEQCIISNAGISYSKGNIHELPFLINHIDLNIDSLYAIKKITNVDTIVDFKAYVKLVINKPDIQLPDTSVIIKIENLFLDTRANEFSVNRLNVFAGNNNGGTDSVVLSNIHVQQFNWAGLLKDGAIEIGLLKAENGATSFDFSDRELFEIKKGNQPAINVKMPIPILLHTVEINAIQYSLRTMGPTGPFTIQLNGDSLRIDEIASMEDSLRPFKIGNLAFKVTNFTNTRDDKSNSSRFDKLIIKDNDLELQNYYRSLAGGRFGAGNSIFIPSLRLVNFSLPALLQYKLRADRLILDKPSLIIDIHASQKKNDADESISKILRSLQPNLDITELSIRDAAINLMPQSTATGKITIENLSTEIDARKLLAAKTIMEMVSAATALSTSGFKIVGDNLNLEVERSALSREMDGVYLEHVKGSIGKTVNLDLYGVSLNDNSGKFDVTKLQTIELDNVSVKKGSVQIDIDKDRSHSINNKIAPAFIIHHARTDNISLHIKNADKNLNLQNISLNGTGILVSKGIATWSQLNINTGIGQWSSPLFAINAESIQMQQPGSIHVDNMSFQSMGASPIKKLIIPGTTIYTDIRGTDFSKPIAKNIIIDHPIIEMILGEEMAAVKSKLSVPSFLIENLTINDPLFSISNTKQMHYAKFSGASGLLTLKNISGDSVQNQLSVQSLNASLKSPTLRLDSGLWQPRVLQIKSHDISYSPIGKSGKVEATIDSIQVLQMQLSLQQPAPIQVNSASVGVADFHYVSTDSFSVPILIKKANWWASAEAVLQESKLYHTAIYNPFISAAKASIFLDSLHIIPLQSRDAFWKSFPFEKDYITLKTGAIACNDYRTTGSGNELKFSAKRLQVDDAVLLIERDKTRGADTVKYRPLLTESFKRIPFLFALDTVQIRNGYVRNIVIPEKSKVEGNIVFSEMNAVLHNVKNVGFNTADTLSFRISSKLMDAGELLVGFRQSYNDSIQKFSMEAKMGPMNLQALNPLLIPLLSIKIERGMADSMMLKVLADDNTAYGYMDLRYHNLRVSLLKKGENQYFLSKIYNWAINLVLRSNTTEKRKPIYQERIQNKTVFNYWAKIAIRGLLTNLGVQLDNKNLRKYRKAIKEKRVPEMVDIL